MIEAEVCVTPKFNGLVQSHALTRQTRKET